MGIATRYLEPLTHKFSQVGLRNTLRVAYLDLSDKVRSAIGKRFPSMALSPRSIQIECTTRCNLKCTFCELSYWTERPADLKHESIRAMVDRLPKLRRIDLTGIGEALMNREFFDIVAFLKSRGLYIAMNDNFTMMTDRSARRIVELGVDQIYVSLDGATKGTYEQLRVGANFDKVIANVGRLVAAKRGPLELAEEELARGNVGRAVRLLEDAIEESPVDLPRLRVLYAETLRRQAGSFSDKDAAQAERLLIKAVKADPKNAAAYFDLGMTYTKSKRYAEAISAFEKIGKELGII